MHCTPTKSNCHVHSLVPPDQYTLTTLTQRHITIQFLFRSFIQCIYLNRLDVMKPTYSTLYFAHTNHQPNACIVYKTMKFIYYSFISNYVLCALRKICASTTFSFSHTYWLSSWPCLLRLVKSNAGCNFIAIVVIFKHMLHCMCAISRKRFEFCNGHKTIPHTIQSLQWIWKRMNAVNFLLTLFS